MATNKVTLIRPGAHEPAPHNFEGDVDQIAGVVRLARAAVEQECGANEELVAAWTALRLAERALDTLRDGLEATELGAASRSSESGHRFDEIYDRMANEVEELRSAGHPSTAVLKKALRELGDWWGRS